MLIEIWKQRLDPQTGEYGGQVKVGEVEFDRTELEELATKQFLLENKTDSRFDYFGITD